MFPRKVHHNNSRTPDNSSELRGEQAIDKISNGHPGLETLARSLSVQRSPSSSGKVALVSSKEASETRSVLRLQPSNINVKVSLNWSNSPNQHAMLRSVAVGDGVTIRAFRWSHPVR